MNTIHSSSLAFYPVAYNKPKPGRVEDSGALTVDGGKGNPNKALSELNTSPSSTEQIKTALAEAGLSNTIASLPNNTRTQKALNAYTQNRNQTAQRQVAEMLSGIDLYA